MKKNTFIIGLLVALSVGSMSAQAADRKVQCSGTAVFTKSVGYSAACIQFNFVESATADNSSLALNGFSGYAIYAEGNKKALDCTSEATAASSSIAISPDGIGVSASYLYESLVNNPKFTAKQGSRYQNDFEFKDVGTDVAGSDYLYINLKYPKPSQSNNAFTLHFDLQEDQNGGFADLNCQYI